MSEPSELERRLYSIRCANPLPWKADGGEIRDAEGEWVELGEAGTADLARLVNALPALLAAEAQAVEGALRSLCVCSGENPRDPPCAACRALASPDTQSPPEG